MRQLKKLLAGEIAENGFKIDIVEWENYNLCVESLILVILSNDEFTPNHPPHGKLATFVSSWYLVVAFGKTNREKHFARCTRFPIACAEVFLAVLRNS